MNATALRQIETPAPVAAPDITVWTETPEAQALLRRVAIRKPVGILTPIPTLERWTRDDHVLSFDCPEVAPLEMIKAAFEIDLLHRADAIYPTDREQGRALYGQISHQPSVADAIEAVL